MYNTVKPLYTLYRTTETEKQKEMVGKRYFLLLNRFPQTVSDSALENGDDVTSRGRLLQRRLPATGNACSPTVDSRVRLITTSLAARMTTTGDGGSLQRQLELAIR